MANIIDMTINQYNTFVYKEKKNLIKANLIMLINNYNSLMNMSDFLTPDFNFKVIPGESYNCIKIELDFNCWCPDQDEYSLNKNNNFDLEFVKEVFDESILKDCVEIEIVSCSAASLQDMWQCRPGMCCDIIFIKKWSQMLDGYTQECRNAPLELRWCFPISYYNNSCNEFICCNYGKEQMYNKDEILNKKKL